MLAGWERRYGHPTPIKYVWQLWPPLATLLCHGAWHVLALHGHTHSKFRHELVVAGVRPRRLDGANGVHGDTDADDASAQCTAQLTSDRFQELSSSLRAWAKFILEHGNSGAAGDDLRLSEAYLAEWASWSDMCEQQLNAKDVMFTRRRGRHWQHPIRILFGFYREGFGQWPHT